MSQTEAPPATAHYPPGTPPYLTLPARAQTVPQVRRLLTDAFRVWGLPEPLIENAELVISELVTNAVRVSGLARLVNAPGAGYIGVLAKWAAPVLVVEVWDPDPAMPQKQEAGEFAESGRGLSIVECLADKAGAYALETGGKVVFARLRHGGDGAP